MRKTAFQRDVLELAKAMEQGITKTKPAFGSYITRYTLKNGTASKVVHACALGAAFVNGFALKKALVEYDKGVTIEDQLQERYPALSPKVFQAVIQKNDAERWPRGRIVAWLRRIAVKFSEAPLDNDYTA